MSEPPRKTFDELVDWFADRYEARLQTRYELTPDADVTRWVVTEETEDEDRGVIPVSAVRRFLELRYGQLAAREFDHWQKQRSGS